MQQGTGNAHHRRPIGTSLPETNLRCGVFVGGVVWSKVTASEESLRSEFVQKYILPTLCLRR